MPLYPPPSTSGSDVKPVVQTSSAAPDNATGVNGDVMVVVRDGGATSNHAGQLVGPKAAGAWPQNTNFYPSLGAANEIVSLPVRSVSMRAGDLLPGWAMEFQTSWLTGTVPSDMTRVGTFGGTGYQASVSGTRAFISRSRTNLRPRSGMAFFSAFFRITALPEASRFVHVGQFTDSGGAPYGYGARIDSAGNVTLRSIDSFISGDVQLASGLSVAANDWLIVERFGWTMTVSKIASGSRQLLGPENATSTNRPIKARVGDDDADVYAPQFAACSFGMFTDSTSVRLERLRFAG